MIFKRIRHGQAAGADGVQQARVVVRGGYSPAVIRARAGRPLRLVFDRQESGECSSRVVFPDFGISAALPAHTQTPVELTPDRAGAFGFSCGMNMIHGTLLVDDGEPAAAGYDPQGGHVSPVAAHSHTQGGCEHGHGEEHEHGGCAQGDGGCQHKDGGCQHEGGCG